MKKLLLISMPYAPVETPSLQITTLQAFLKQYGIIADTKSLYVPFADRIGLQKYEKISIESFVGEANFAALLYPQIKKKIDNQFNCDILLSQAEIFIKEITRKIPIDNYEYIGFSVVFKQLFSSLAITKRLKELNPSLKIIFGGDSCNEEKGISLMKLYPEIDYVISREGEYPLLHLLEGKPPRDIKGLTYRENGTVIMNPPSNEIVDLGTQAISDFTEYFDRINETRYLKKVLKFARALHMPVETSRSCWWNRCTFCNLNSQYQKYREKPNTNIAQEIINQKNKYNIHRILFVSNNIHLRKPGELFRLLKPLGLEIALEYSARMSNFNLLQQLKEAGVTRLQFGLESLSKGLLEKKMKKGVHLIDNVQTLKFLKELNIASDANLIIHYPNETRKEFTENIKYFKYLYHLEPPMISPFGLSYKSPIFNNPGTFNIKRIFPRKEYEEFIPKNILNRLIFPYYDYKKNVESSLPQHILIRELHRWMKKFVNNSSYPLLYYKALSDVLLIRDNRSGNTVDYRLGNPEIQIYLFCHSAQSEENIYQNFSDTPKYYIKSVLEYLVKHRLMFKDDSSYISLAIDLETHKKYLLKDRIKRHKYVECKRIHIK